MTNLILCAAALANSQGAQKGPDVEKAVVASPKGRVTASYIRMHAPDLVFDMARQVKSGKLDASALDGFLGQNARRSLLGGSP